MNEVAECVNTSVIICFNKEMASLNAQIQVNNMSQYGGNITIPSFKLYIDILEEASKAISSINCSIKDTLNKNLQAIKKNHIEGQKRNRERLNYTSTGRSTYSGGSTYSGVSSSSGFEWKFGLLWILGCGGGCAAISGEAEMFWLGVRKWRVFQ